MPLEYNIDSEKRIVNVRTYGVLKDSELFDYLWEVGSRLEFNSYDQIIDMTEVTDVEYTSAERIKELASVAASMDTSENVSKLAIVAPQSLLFGLGRMYQSFREFSKGSKRDIKVFRSLQEALDWLASGVSRLSKNSG